MVISIETRFSCVLSKIRRSVPAKLLMRNLFAVKRLSGDTVFNGMTLIE